MSFTGLLNQRGMLYPKTGYTGDGAETYGNGELTKARVQVQTKRRLLPNGTVLTIDAIAYFPGTVTIESDYKFVYNSVTYKVVSIYNAIDGAGRVHNIKAELVKWQTA